jgi:hypothetical protein
MHDWREIVRRRLSDLGVDPIADATLIEELAHHLEDRFNESQARGAAGGQAMADALHELDQHERLSPELAKNRPAPSLPHTGRWTAARQPSRGSVAGYPVCIAHAPPQSGIRVAATLTVALSTAPTIAVLSVGNWLFLRPVAGVSEPEKLATLMFGIPSEGDGLSVVRPSYDHVAAMAASSPSIQGMAGWQTAEISIASGEGEPRTVPAEFVSGNYFDLLGVRMFAGRPFLPEEDRPPDGALVAVLSHRLARTLFNDRSPIGTSIQLNRHPVTVIGVAPRDFSGRSLVERTDIWLPGQATWLMQHLAKESRRPDRGPFYQYVIRTVPSARWRYSARRCKS